MVHPVDIHVGRKIREARLVRGYTQAGVAKELGLSFQQLQKYETGHNRVSASKLYELSKLFDVSPSHFFSGLQAAEEGDAELMDDQTAKAVMALASIRDEKVKNQLRSMILEIARNSAEQVRASA
jgi:transcriptional regulator with XRE-family HTH domain